MLTFFSFIIISLFTLNAPLHAATASFDFQSIDDVTAALPPKYKLAARTMWNEHKQDQKIYDQRQPDLLERGVLTQLSDQPPCDDAEKLIEIYQTIINEIDAKAEAIRAEITIRNHAQLAELCPMIFEKNIALKMIELAEAGEAERAEVMRLVNNISKRGKLAPEKRVAIRALVRLLRDMKD